MVLALVLFSIAGIVQSARSEGGFDRDRADRTNAARRRAAASTSARRATSARRRRPSWRARRGRRRRRLRNSIHTSPGRGSRRSSTRQAVLVRIEDRLVGSAAVASSVAGIAAVVDAAKSRCAPRRRPPTPSRRSVVKRRVGFVVAGSSSAIVDRALASCDSPPSTKLREEDRAARGREHVVAARDAIGMVEVPGVALRVRHDREHVAGAVDQCRAAPSAEPFGIAARRPCRPRARRRTRRARRRRSRADARASRRGGLRRAPTHAGITASVGKRAP